MNFAGGQPILPARPDRERCPCFAPFEDGLCAYCERPEAEHDERAIHGPHVDPTPGSGSSALIEPMRFVPVTGCTEPT